jgi:hypothetical protein
LWGHEAPANLNDAALTKAWADFSIRPKAPLPLDARDTTVPPKSTAHATQLRVAAARKANAAIDAASAAVTPGRVRDTLQRPDVRALRKKVLAGLLPEAEAESDFSALTVAQWRDAPQLVRCT